MSTTDCVDVTSIVTDLLVTGLVVQAPSALFYRFSMNFDISCNI